jgi:hypothetical protein
MHKWVDIVKGRPQMPPVIVCMGKTGASPSPHALSAVEQILAANPQKQLTMEEIVSLYHSYQSIVAFQDKELERLHLHKVNATKAGDFMEVRRLEKLIDGSYTVFLTYNHYIDILFSHGPPSSKLKKRRRSVESAFNLIRCLYFSKAREILHELLTSVYFREVAIFILALMALRGQFDDQDARGTCREKVDSDLAAAWVSKLTDPRLLNMYTEATCMNHDDLWHYKFRGIWSVLGE